jgi:hypothetical protein
MGDKWPIKFSLQCDFHRDCKGFLHAAKLRHGTDDFTSPPKEGMPKNPTASVGFEPANLCTIGQHANHQTTEAADLRHCFILYAGSYMFRQ